MLRDELRADKGHRLPPRQHGQDKQADKGVSPDAQRAKVAAYAELYDLNIVPLLSVGEQIDTRSAAGRLVLNVLASVSQWEREAIGERTAVAMQHKASSGEYTGGVPPYGYRVAEDGVHLVEVESEQAVLAAARQLRAAGLSLRGVARELDERGFRSRVDTRFSAAQIRSMVA